MATTEAPPLPAAAPSRAHTSFSELLSKYGLIGLLLAMPVAFGVHDLATGENLSRLGNNLFQGLSNGSIVARPTARM